MAAITVQQALAAGITLSLNAAASGDTVANPRGRTFFIAKNGDASAKTLTIPAQMTNRPADGQFPGLTVPDISVVIAAGATALVGPVPLAYNNSNGSFVTNWSAVTSVTSGAFEAV